MSKSTYIRSGVDWSGDGGWNSFILLREDVWLNAAAPWWHANSFHNVSDIRLEFWGGVSSIPALMISSSSSVWNDHWTHAEIGIVHVGFLFLPQHFWFVYQLTVIRQERQRVADDEIQSSSWQWTSLSECKTQKVVHIQPVSEESRNLEMTPAAQKEIFVQVLLFRDNCAWK